ncbi:Glycosyl transferase family 2 [Syntrophus gentianae]|uniref:Glycosyl transferase family 2 n=1 Tax=Syntrophus gentianae TaxID=43775 RepID=A0A1H8BET0_9BACT|nr:glycosyltransferase family A protein [Syntrophus gentianae]SEM81312.1 Glycosyl transferase family 2 [Syntrophus gentianae]
MLPLISVVIPLYNKAEYIQRALASVLNQSFQLFEIIVVNDGSTDGGEKRVQSMTDHRIRLINQDNAGVSAARNAGVASAKSEYIAFLDADDEWNPGFLEEISILQRNYPEAVMYATSYEIINGNDRYQKKFNLPTRSLLYLNQYIECCIESGTPICASAVVISKMSLHKIGGFPMGQNRGEDLDTWFRLLRKSPAAYCNLPFALYWIGLPNSSCLANKEIVLVKPLFKEIEDEVASLSQDSEMYRLLMDYLAYQKLMIIERLLLYGRGQDARSLIASVWVSERLKKKLSKSYIKSFIPCTVLLCWINIKTKLKQIFCLSLA